MSNLTAKPPKRPSQPRRMPESSGTWQHPTARRRASVQCLPLSREINSLRWGAPRPKHPDIGDHPQLTPYRSAISGCERLGQLRSLSLHCKLIRLAPGSVGRILSRPSWPFPSLRRLVRAGPERWHGSLEFVVEANFWAWQIHKKSCEPPSGFAPTPTHHPCHQRPRLGALAAGGEGPARFAYGLIQGTAVYAACYAE